MVRVGGVTDDRFSGGLTTLGDRPPAILVYDATEDAWTTVLEESLLAACSSPDTRSLRYPPGDWLRKLVPTVGQIDV